MLCSRDVLEDKHIRTLVLTSFNLLLNFLSKAVLSQSVWTLYVEIKGLSLCCLAHELDSSSANQTGTQSSWP